MSNSKRMDDMERIRKHDDAALLDLAEFFKVFGDTTRIRILSLLFRKEMCVGDIAAALRMQQSAISHQLKILKQTRLARSRKEGKLVYYFLTDSHIKKIFDQGYTHIIEERRS